MNRTVQKQKREMRTRGKIKGTADMPRLSVFRSNNHMYAQIINDVAMNTVCGVSEKQLSKMSGTKTEIAYALGKYIAEKAKSLKVQKVAFDKGSYRYHGRIKSFAQGAREGGLTF